MSNTFRSEPGSWKTSWWLTIMWKSDAKDRHPLSRLQGGHHKKCCRKTFRSIQCKRLKIRQRTNISQTPVRSRIVRIQAWCPSPRIAPWTRMEECRQYLWFKGRLDPIGTSHQIPPRKYKSRTRKRSLATHYWILRNQVPKSSLKIRNRRCLEREGWAKWTS